MIRRYVILAAVVIASAVGWTAYWRHLSTSAAQGPAQVVLDLRQSGWRAEVGAVAVEGFPGRLDVRAAAPGLGLSDGSWAWTAPWLQAAALFYQRDHWVLDWPSRQHLETPGGNWRLETPEMRASLVFDGAVGPGRAPLLLRLSLDAPNSRTVHEAGGGEASADRLQLHFRAAPEVSEGGPWRYEILVRGAGLRVTAGGETLSLKQLEARGVALLERPIRSRPATAPDLILLEEFKAVAANEDTRIEVERSLKGFQVSVLGASGLIKQLNAMGAFTKENFDALSNKITPDDSVSTQIMLDGSFLEQSNYIIIER